MRPAELRRAGAGLGVPLDEPQIERLTAYVQLIERWNARFNLISRRDVDRLWPRHVLDSLSIAPFLRADGLGTDGAGTAETDPAVAVDIGTGAGLPGLPLAIAAPGLHWHLIDRNRRKIRFLETVVATLALDNVTAHAVDLGARPLPGLAGQADLVVSRAVDEPAGLVKLAEPLLGPRARLILMTGAVGAGTAVGPLTEGFRISSVHHPVIPGLDRTHEVTIIERAES